MAFICRFTCHSRNRWGKRLRGKRGLRAERRRRALALGGPRKEVGCASSFLLHILGVGELLRVASMLLAGEMGFPVVLASSADLYIFLANVAGTSAINGEPVMVRSKLSVRQEDKAWCCTYRLLGSLCLRRHLGRWGETKRSFGQGPPFCISEPLKII